MNFDAPQPTGPSVEEGRLLWTPPPERVASARLTRFRAWLHETRGLAFDSYGDLWRWSVDDKEAFWRAIWDHFDVLTDAPFARAVSGDGMPGARWFEGSRTNYAEHLLRREATAPDEVAVVHSSERRPLATLTWRQLGDHVRTVAERLRGLGVGPGDRVVSYMPNTPETMAAMIATVAVGAVWSAAAPEFGARTVIERFGQIEPKVLFAADGYSFDGKVFDRRGEVEAIGAGLPSLAAAVFHSYVGCGEAPDLAVPVHDHAAFAAAPPVTREAFRFERVAPDHPLWVLFSSGTTGLPKPIVHGHAGMIAEHLKAMALHMDLGPGKRMFFYTTTGWMVWNSVVASLISGASAVLYDGSPTFGGIDALWRMAAETRTTSFGASPTLVGLMKKAGVSPGDRFNLSALDTITLAGAPATPETFAWAYEHVKPDLWVASQSGGTDLCSGLVISAPTEPVYAGEIQVRPLGIDTHVWNDAGEEVVDEIGEMVVTSPFPSAPLFFWGDRDGERLHEAYYATFPGVWRHGDLAKINSRGGAYIYGRSDATLNRFGVRIGTAEIYRVVEQVDGVTDSLVVCCALRDGGHFMPMFVSLAPGALLDEALKGRIAARLRREASPRHVPDEIHAAPAIPYTLTGKKMEVPVRKLLSGLPPERAASRDAMAQPRLLDWYAAFAREAAARGLSGSG